MKMKSFVGPWLTLMVLTLSGSAGLAASVDRSALETAFERLPQYQYGQAEESLQVIDAAVTAAQSDETLRQDLERNLLAILEGEGTAVAKNFACRKLALIGSEKSVHGLAVLLENPELAHMARFALERIPGPATDEALRGALERTGGLLKVGVINSLGNRRDPRAVPALEDLLKQRDHDIAQAALAALGKIGTVEAGQVLSRLTGSVEPELLPALEDAQLSAAENLLQQAEKEQALGIYRHLDSSGCSEHVRLAGFKGLLEVEPELAQGRLLQALADPNAARRGLAARMVAQMPEGRDLTPFLQALPTLPPAGQVALLDTLALRKEAAASPLIRDASQSVESGVRRAALSALGQTGGAADALFLAERAAQAGEPERQVARQSLARLGGQDTDTAMAEGLTNTPPVVRIELIHALVARSAAGAAAAIAGQLDAAQPGLRQAAIDALGALGTQEQIPPLVNRLRAAEADAELTALQNALVAICARERRACAAAILPALPNFQGPQRIVLLNTLHLMGGSDALQIVRADTKAMDPEVKDAALRVLAAWPEIEAMPDLLNLAKSSEDRNQQVVAFRGYIRLLRASPMPAEAKAVALNEAMGIASRREEKVLVLAGFGDLKNLPALKRTERHLYDPDIAEEASVTLCKIVSGLDPLDKFDAAVALEQVLQVTREQRTREEAEQLLRKQGAPRLTGAGGTTADPSLKRIVFIAGPMDHAGPGAHEYPKDLLLLKQCLDRAAKGFVTEIYFGQAPPDLSQLDNAATLVIHSSGNHLPGERHVLFPYGGEGNPEPYPAAAQKWLDQLDTLMKRGCGIVVLHYALWADHPTARAYLLDWIGGYHDKDQSRVQIVTAEARPAAFPHPILQGVKPWTTQEEYYFHQHFRPNDPRLTPILETDSPEGNGVKDVIAWAVVRDGGGRGFGFTGCHYHQSLFLEEYRQLVLNAILWTAGLGVPEDGVASEIPSGWR